MKRTQVLSNIPGLPSTMAHDPLPFKHMAIFIPPGTWIFPEMKKKIWSLMQYLDAKWYTGRGIRWMIRGRNGRTPYCAFCGNFANAVGIVEYKQMTFNLPICKTHVTSYLDKHKPDGWAFMAPAAFKMNIKF